MRAAAIQLEADLGNVDHNLEVCERLARAAGEAGAELIILPEFFSTGVAFSERLLGAERPPDGEPVALLSDIARRFGALAGGSFLCADPDGEVRNAFFVVSPEGVVGRHDKDIPTMWERCFYVGGSDDGLIEHAGISYGAALCWEFLRAQTTRRLRGGVDVVVGGSCVWGAPDRFFPAWFRRSIDHEVDGWSGSWASIQARLIGAPVVEATHCGTLVGRAPWLGFEYRSRLRGGARICAADGSILAHVHGDVGSSFVVADIEPTRMAPADVPSAGWYVTHVSAPVRFTHWYQTIHGARWYRRHRPPTLRR